VLVLCSRVAGCDVYKVKCMFAGGVCIFMFKLSWRLSMVTVVGLPIMMILSEVYGQFLRVHIACFLKSTPCKFSRRS
jgi:ABC-type multidrug transport system fused ATPase/permease subunit